MQLTSLILTRESILLAMGEFLVVKDDHLQPADMIHIMAGNSERVDYAVELYHQGYARRLFVSGACGQPREQVLAAGVRPEDLAPDESWSHTTYEEALELKEFLDGNPSVQSVIVVSSPDHMRQAAWSHKKVLGERVPLQFAPVPDGMDAYERRWWTGSRWRKLVVKEYLGVLSYYLRYQLAG